MPRRPTTPKTANAAKKKRAEITTNLFESIPRFRKLRSLTQEGLAQKVGVTLNHIARIEGRGYEPSAGLLPKLMQALGATADELLCKPRTMSDEERNLEALLQTIRELDAGQRDMLAAHADIYKNKRKMKVVFLPIPGDEVE